MITDPSIRREKVVESIKLFDSTAKLVQQHGQLLLKLAAHPDTDPNSLSQAAVQYRDSVQSVYQIKTKLLEAAQKERVPLLLVDRLNNTKVLP